MIGNLQTEMFNLISDGYAYYEEWQHLLQKSDKHAKELLESFGAKCNHHEVCDFFMYTFR